MWVSPSQLISVLVDAKVILVSSLLRFKCRVCAMLDTHKIARACTRHIGSGKSSSLTFHLPFPFPVGAATFTKSGLGGRVRFEAWRCD